MNESGFCRACGADNADSFTRVYGKINVGKLILYCICAVAEAYVSVFNAAVDELESFIVAVVVDSRFFSKNFTDSAD